MKINYDAYRKELTINDVIYAEEVFENFSNLMPLNTPFMLISRDDGILTIKRCIDE